jgi:hypothetical protein
VALAAMTVWAVDAMPAMAQAIAPPQVFARPLQPYGVAALAGGNVLVSSDAALTTLRTRFGPDGSVQAQQTVGGIQTGELAAEAVDPADGRVWDLSISGNLRMIDPATMTIVDIGSLRSTPAEASQVYDVAVGLVRDFTGSVLVAGPGGELTLANSTFGDIAARRSEGGHRLDLLVTGRTSANARYVARVTFVDGVFQAPVKVLISSSAISAFHNYPSGIALNAAGLAATTLTACTGRTDLGQCAGIADYAVTFPIGLPAGTPALVRPPNISATGGSADAAGRLYLTGPIIATATCGDVGLPGIAVLNPTGQYLGCIKLAGAGTFQDLALTADDATAYTTHPAGLVLRWGRLADAVPAVPPGGGGSGGDGGGGVAIDPAIRVLTAPRATVRRLRVTRGRVRVRVSNPNTVPIRLRAVLSRRSAARTRTLASTALTLDAHQSRRVSLRLRPTARALLRRRAKLQARLALTASATGAASVQTSRAVVLRAR